MTTGKLRLNDSLTVLRDGALGRLGCISENSPYVVPVNYYFDGKYIYVHTLPGKKLNALRSNPRACLQVDEIEDAYHWKSVIAFGDFEEVKGDEAKEKALSDIFSKLPHMSPVESRMIKGLSEAIVFRLKVNEITGVGENW
jgi:nitroimidazol reductase NimA-like FMN-containing flavoprotein (pyridoxamine 5'-phosphate oxidase superfamily)